MVLYLNHITSSLAAMTTSRCYISFPSMMIIINYDCQMNEDKLTCVSTAVRMGVALIWMCQRSSSSLKSV